jgi:hypothetical protein
VWASVNAVRVRVASVKDVTAADQTVDDHAAERISRATDHMDKQG